MNNEITKNEPVVFHFRVGTGIDTNPKSGATVVFLPELKRFGIALCCPSDRYVRKWGRKIAEYRAMAGDLALVRERERTQARRFNCFHEYTGTMNFDEVRQKAQELAYLAARSTSNRLYIQKLFQECNDN